MTRFLLFVSSLAPAVLVVGIRLIGETPFGGMLTILTGILLFPLSYFVLRLRRSVTPKPIKVVEVADENFQILTYVLTFIFPFLFIDIGDTWNAVAYVVLILFVLVLLIRSDLSLVNPALLVIGYHIYSLRAEGGEDLILISKFKPRLGQALSARKLSGHVYLIDQVGTERMNG